MHPGWPLCSALLLHRLLIWKGLCQVRDLVVVDELMLKEIQVSSGGVRGVWIRNDLQIRHHRLLRLEEMVRKRNIKLSEEQIQALERFDPEYRERHIQVAS